MPPGVSPGQLPQDPQAARLLVVDDEPGVSASLSCMLAREGYVVHGVHTAIDALALVGRDDFDVLLTDVVMEGMTGLELCARVQGMRPEMPIIVMTGHSDLRMAIDAMRAGACDFITKPADLSVLRASLARAVQRSRCRALTCAPDHARALIGSSGAMRRVRELVARVGGSDVSVLIHGETGTGKELVARALHVASGREGPCIAVNCAALPKNLVESELFGHVRGAFTDARARRNGLFADADGGTLLLDEIGELPLDLQPKLLRALQERAVRPVGANLEVPFDTRVLAATNRDLAAAVAAGRFREDLYYRIDVMSIALPPLRKRERDVLELAAHFLGRVTRERASRPLGITDGAAELLLAYGWPGNVRELDNCIEHAAVLARGSAIDVDDLPERLRDARPRAVIPTIDEPDADALLPLMEIERRHILRVLSALGGNKARAANVLGVSRKTLYRKLLELGRHGSN